MILSLSLAGGRKRSAREFARCIETMLTSMTLYKQKPVA
jgi:hypothetical protein